MQAVPSRGAKAIIDRMAKASVFPYLPASALPILDGLATPMHIYCFDSERIAWANRAGLDIWNATTLDELRRRDLAPFSDATRARLAEYREAFKRGEERTETWVLYPKRIATPVLDRCTGVSIDGHAQAMLVEHLIPSSAMPVDELRTLEAVRHTPLMTTLHDMSGRVLVRNPAAAKYFWDFDRSAPHGEKHFHAMFADPTLGAQLLAQAASSREAEATAVMAIMGSPVHEVAIALVTDPTTGERAILVYQRDVSEAVETRRKLDESEEALNLVLNLSTAPIFILPASGHALLDANGPAQQSFPEGFRDDIRRIFIHRNDLADMRNDLLSGRRSNWQFQLRARDDRPFRASISAVRFRFRGTDAFLAAITALDQFPSGAPDSAAADAFEHRTWEMEQTLLAIASHEFRTPLAIIDSAAQRIERRVAMARSGTGKPLSDDDLTAPVHRIRATVQRLVRLIEDTLAQADPMEAGGSFTPEPTDLSALIAGICNAFRERHPEMVFDLNLPLLPLIDIDHDLFNRVVGNILENAIKYARDEVRIDISAAANSEEITLVFRDYGIGIPLSERSRVFDPFHRGSNVGARPGTGLGLAIVRQIVAMHDGFIDIDETDGPGATFRVHLTRRAPSTAG
ncbi:MAG: hypothetical protein RIS94_1994 [Pseudomonadota bacterium]